MSEPAPRPRRRPAARSRTSARAAPGATRTGTFRPHVRGVAMNPVDHPHGGGEGKTSGGRHPVSPSGKPEGRTRQPGKASDRQIIRRRRTGKNKR